MPKLPGLTTGEVRGQLGLSEATLMRYVKEFRDHFSDQVGKRRLGKRWNVHDINNLLVIRSMKVRHEKHEAIVEALASGKTFEDVSPTLSAAMMLDVSMRNLQQIIKYADQIRAMTQTAKWNEEEYTWIVKTVKAQWKSYDKRLIKLEHDIALIKFYLHNPTRRYPTSSKWKPIINELMQAVREKLYISDNDMLAYDKKYQATRTED